MMEITDLPDYALLTILSFLDASSLYDISRTSERFNELAKANRLWKYIDARRTPNRLGKIEYCCKRTYEHTKHIRFRGEIATELLISTEFYVKLCDFNYISVLALENQFIDGSKVKLINFPATLNELSLRRSTVRSSSQFFRFSFEILINLRVLILNECDWVETSSFMSLGKYRNLEILSIYKCRKLENVVAYLSIAGSLGFQKLKLLDARLSGLGHAILKYLHKNTSLLAVYLQNEDDTYRLDYFKRKLDLAQGAKPVDYYTEDKEFDLNEELHDTNSTNHEFPVLTDFGLVDYLYTQGKLDDEQLPTSDLYEDPYTQCTCNNKQQSNRGNNGNSSNHLDFSQSHHFDSDSDDDDDDDSDDAYNNYSNCRSKLIKKLSRKIRALKEIIRRSSNQNNDLIRNVLRATALSSSSIASTSNSTSPNTQGQKRYREEDGGAKAVLAQRRILDMFQEKFQNGTYDRDRNHLGKIQDNVLDDDTLDDFFERHKAMLLEGALAAVSGDDSPHNITTSSSSSSGGGGDDGIEQEIPDNSGTVRVVNLTLNLQSSPGPSAAEDEEEEEDEDPSENHINKRARVAVAAPRPPTPYPNIVNIEDNNASGVTIRRILFDNYPLRIRANPNKDKIEIPLKRLSLRGYRRISDVSLHYLQGLNLKLLDLTYTNVTEKGIRDFLTYHPECRILHEKFCTCKPKLHF